MLCRWTAADVQTILGCGIDCALHGGNLNIVLVRRFGSGGLLRRRRSCVRWILHRRWRLAGLVFGRCSCVGWILHRRRCLAGLVFSGRCLVGLALSGSAFYWSTFCWRALSGCTFRRGRLAGLALSRICFCWRAWWRGNIFTGRILRRCGCAWKLGAFLCCID